LENAIERAVVFTNTNLISLAALPQSLPAFRESRPSLTFKIGMPWRELERQAIELTLAHARGSKPIAARMLGVAIRTIYRHLRSTKLGVQQDSDKFKDRKTMAPRGFIEPMSPEPEGVPKSTAHCA
jgi:DNA-binding NtrC family response regulator